MYLKLFLLLLEIAFPSRLPLNTITFQLNNTSQYITVTVRQQYLFERTMSRVTFKLRTTRGSIQIILSFDMIKNLFAFILGAA